MWELGGLNPGPHLAQNVASALKICSKREQNRKEIRNREFQVNIWCRTMEAYVWFGAKVSYLREWRSWGDEGETDRIPSVFRKVSLNTLSCQTATGLTCQQWCTGVYSFSFKNSERWGALWSHVVLKKWFIQSYEQRQEHIWLRSYYFKDIVQFHGVNTVVSRGMTQIPLLHSSTVRLWQINETIIPVTVVRSYTAVPGLFDHASLQLLYTIGFLDWKLRANPFRTGHIILHQCCYCLYRFKF